MFTPPGWTLDPNYRRVLLRREDVQRLWPVPPELDQSDAAPERDRLLREARKAGVPGAGRGSGSTRAASEMEASDTEERRARKWRREKWRRDWIARFAERQRIARRWIALVDLVDWCAQSATTASLEAEAKARDVAYRRLTDSVRKGEFERDGLSKILYLDTLVTSDGRSPRCRLTREQFEIAANGAAMPPVPSPPVTVLNCCWLPSAMAGRWLESHGYRWAPQFGPAPAREAAHHDTISWDEASARIGKAKFGADWIGKLTERERWLVERYIKPRQDRASTIISETITYIGPGGPFVPVNDRALAAEVERARDRLEQMTDQFEQVHELLEDWGFDVESAQLDLGALPVADAVAASAAFPILLSPIDLQNHSVNCRGSIPKDEWIAKDMNKPYPRYIDLGEYRAARYANALRHGEGAYRNVEYLHLLDGGLTDNLGVNSLLDVISPHGSFRVLDAINSGKLRRLVVITVNARSDPASPLDQQTSTPGIVSMVNSVISNPIDAATSSVAAQERTLLSEIRDAAKNAPPDALFGGVHLYNIEIDFDQFLPSQIDLEREVKSIPTLWTISKEQLGELDQAARLLLHQHPCFQALLLDLSQSAPFLDPTFAGNGCPQPQPPGAMSTKMGVAQGLQKAGLVRNSGRPPTDTGHRGG